MTQLLYEKNFLHYTVNHSTNYVELETGAHAQSIEGHWSVYRQIVRRKGTNIGEVSQRVNAYHIYRFLKDNGNNIFDSFFNL